MEPDPVRDGDVQDAITRLRSHMERYSKSVWEVSIVKRDVLALIAAYDVALAEVARLRTQLTDIAQRAFRCGLSSNSHDYVKFVAALSDELREDVLRAHGDTQEETS